MGAQDKIERTLKRIHLLFAEGESPDGDPAKVIVDKTEVFDILDDLNRSIYEMMEQYEMTSQSRELARRRTEKKGEELIARVSRQTEDVYAASLIYTDDALNKVHRLMTEALTASREIWHKLSEEVEQEQRKIKEDQAELHGQLQDFKDCNKYLNIIKDYNREQEKKEREAQNPPSAEKKIQNQAKHYPMKTTPEIRVNPAYFQRRGLNPDGTQAASLSNHSEEAGDIPPMPEKPEEESKESFIMPEIKVDLDAEYFKWQEENRSLEEGAEADSRRSRRERRFPFGKK